MNKPFAKHSQVHVGSVLVIDSGFTCMPDGSRKTVYNDGSGLYIHCDHGKHYINGQLDHQDQDTLVGLYLDQATTS